MKVAAIAPIRFSSPDCVTGDATQMRETVKALRMIPGIEVECLYYASDKALSTSNGDSIRWSELADKFDVAHLFTMLPKGYAKVHPHLAKLPTLLSTVFWNNLFREYISVKNGTTPRFIIRSFEYIFRRLTGLKKRNCYSWCSGILPNSWAEGNVFRKEFALKDSAFCVPIPNAITLPCDITDLPRSEDVPSSDYIVCPGIFAPRKNQIALIKAMQGSNIPIVFMGKSFDPIPHFYDKCKRLADNNMYFLGHIPSNSEKYWAILRHARAAVLTSDCETPGIAMLEAALAGARPIVPLYGGTPEYYGLMAEYLNPFSRKSIKEAVISAWNRGRLTSEEADSFKKFSWTWTAQLTAQAYNQSIKAFRTTHFS